ncbi:MAG: hypothetical protein JJ957_17165 [Pseudomonadales bacterium]|nr:hypothetical protein [Pseudomonadales bacterium]MBO6597327.1 hypothetical protein [Pseudomonadales bacterium]MBO6824061.1 hypothetical protein [Pseudomonadales bacterium]
MTVLFVRPVLLFVLSGLLLCFAIAQAVYYVLLPYAIPSSFELDTANLIGIFAKLLACLYLIISCVLLLKGLRLGAYLVEFAVLFSLVSSIWGTFKTWYYIENLSLMPNALGWLVHVAFFVALVAAHLLFLWCLRNEKAILYFNLEKRADV